MGIVNLKVPSLLQGMSQQTPRLRRDNEADLQVNAISDTTYGMGTRPGTEHIAILSGVENDPDLWAHFIKRDDAERYVFTFDGASLRVFNLIDGVSYPLQADAAALAYLATQNPREDLFGLTVQDSTFIVNRRKTVSLDPYTVPVPGVQAIVWVRAGNYRTEYSVTVDGTTTTYETRRADQAADGATESIKTSTIADRIVNGWTTDDNPDGVAGVGLQADLDAAHGAGVFTVTNPTNTSIILVQRVDEADFSISVNDSVADSQMELIKQETSRFDQLPPKAPHGFTARIVGLEDAVEDDYWVRFVAENPSEDVSDGRWEETAAPGAQTRFDASSMPHELKRLQDDASGTATGTPYGIYFRLQAVNWIESPAGDDESNPAPSFVGRTIDSLFVLDGRLGFLSGSQVVLSASGDFFLLRRSSVTSLDPNDRIDATAGEGEVVNLRYAVALSEQLLLAGDDALMAVPTNTTIEPSTFRFTTATRLRVDTKVPPLVVGRSLFLPVRNGSYSDIREAVASGVERVKDSRTITLQVPELLLGSVDYWTADDSGYTLYAKGSSASRRIYVYKWLDSTDSRIQSSWGFWLMSAAVLAFQVIDKRMWLLMDRPEGVTLESINLDASEPQPGQFIPFRLDRYTVLTTPATSAGDGEPPDPDTGGGGGGPTSGSGGTNVGGASGVDNAPEDPPASYSQGFSTAIPADTNESQTVITAVDPSGPQTPRTSLELPYAPPASMQVVRADTGEIVPWFTTDEPRTIELEGDVAALPLVAGETYDMLYRFSEAMVREPTAAGGRVAMTNARLQILRLRINYSQSGPFLVDIYDGDEMVNYEVFSPFQVGDQYQPLQSYTGTFSVPIRMDSRRAGVRIRVNGYQPCWFVSAEWEGDLRKYGTSI